MTNQPERDAVCSRCDHEYSRHPYGASPGRPGLACSAFVPEPTTEARPCACGHLSNRHNALVSGRCQQLGCDCPDYQRPEPEHAFTAFTTGLGIRRSLPITRVVVDRETFEQLSAELDAYRRVLSIALDTERELSHAELRAYAADAIRYARTLPPPVRSGETMTVAEVSSGSPYQAMEDRTEGEL